MMHNYQKVNSKTFIQEAAMYKICYPFLAKIKSDSQARCGETAVYQLLSSNKSFFDMDIYQQAILFN